MENERGKLTSKPWFIVVLLIFFFPAGIFFMWKNKIFPTWARIAVTCFFLLLCIVAGGSSDNESTSNKKVANSETTKTEVATELEDDAITDEKNEEAEKKDVPEEKSYDTQFMNDFADLVKEYNAELTDTSELIASEDGTNNLVAGVLIENNEETVNAFLDSLKTLVEKSDECDTAVITFGDIKKGSDGELLLLASITDGKIETSMESSSYNTAHNQWVNSQFSAWDGSHTELTKLIKKSLNDEKSYKHINTTYRDIKTQEDADEVNKAIKSAGKSNTVEVGDLFIMTDFSAKNGFNATIKSTAYGIASYSNNTITLITIE